MKELIDHVAKRAQLTKPQANEAVDAVLEYLTARLPSPIVGRIREQLDAAAVSTLTPVQVESNT